MIGYPKVVQDGKYTVTEDIVQFLVFMMIQKIQQKNEKSWNPKP